MPRYTAATIAIINAQGRGRLGTFLQLARGTRALSSERLRFFSLSLSLLYDRTTGMAEYTPRDKSVCITGKSGRRMERNLTT